MRGVWFCAYLAALNFAAYLLFTALVYPVRP